MTTKADRKRAVRNKTRRSTASTISDFCGSLLTDNPLADMADEPSSCEGCVTAKMCAGEIGPGDDPVKSLLKAIQCLHSRLANLEDDITHLEVCINIMSAYLLKDGAYREFLGDCAKVVKGSKDEEPS